MAVPVSPGECGNNRRGTRGSERSRCRIAQGLERGERRAGDGCPLLEGEVRRDRQRLAQDVALQMSPLVLGIGPSSRLREQRFVLMAIVHVGRCASMSRPVLSVGGFDGSAGHSERHCRRGRHRRAAPDRPQDVADDLPSSGACALTSGRRESKVRELLGTREPRCLSFSTSSRRVGDPTGSPCKEEGEGARLKAAYPPSPAVGREILVSTKPRLERERPRAGRAGLGGDTSRRTDVGGRDPRRPVGPGSRPAERRAVHLASALALGDPELVVAVWGRRLHDGVRSAHLRVAPIRTTRRDPITPNSSPCGRG